MNKLNREQNVQSVRFRFVVFHFNLFPQFMTINLLATIQKIVERKRNNELAYAI